MAFKLKVVAEAELLKTTQRSREITGLASRWRRDQAKLFNSKLKMSVKRTTLGIAMSGLLLCLENLQRTLLKNVHVAEMKLDLTKEYSLEVASNHCSSFRLPHHFWPSSSTKSDEFSLLLEREWEINIHFKITSWLESIVATLSGCTEIKE